MKKVLTLCVFLSCMVFAKNSDSIVHVNSEPRLPPSLNYSKYYLDLSKEDKKIDEIYEKDIEVKKKLDYIENIEISNRPSKIILNSTMFLTLHPKYPSSIIFPSGYTITNIHSFQQKDVFWEYDKNIIDVKASDDLTEQTMMIKYANEKGYKYATNIVVNRYVNSDGVLHNIYEVIQPKKLDIQEVLNKYYNKYGNFPTKTTYIKINNVMYHFKEDKDGDINLNGKKFFFRYGNE